MSALLVHEEELFDASVVEDALAFIDAFYTPAAEPGASSVVQEWRTGTDLWSTTADNLHAALEEVYHKLVAVNRHTGIEKAVLSVGADFGEIQLRLDFCRRLCLEVLQPPWSRSIRSLGDPTIAGLLWRRLDEVIACVSSGASERPLLQQGGGSSFKAVAGTYDDHPHSEFAVRRRCGRFIPFKLSDLIRAAWGSVLDQSLSGPGHSQARMFEQQDEVLVQIHDDDDGTQGSMAFRRVPLPDGSVLLCWTGFHATPYPEVYDPLDIVGDSEIHQLGWMRVGRLIQDSQPSPRVYMEYVTDLAVRPVCRVFPDYALTRRRFERFKSFLHAQLEAIGPDNRQLFENRLLDASLKTYSSRGVNEHMRY